MPPRDDLICFLDLETTGTDENLDSIIEIGLSLVSTEEGYPEVGSFAWTINPTDAAFIRMMDNRIVREMHEANGLLEEVLDLRSKRATQRTPEERHDVWVHTLDGAAANANIFLDGFVKGDNTHIPLGGSGVLHFDSKFLAAQMPSFKKRLTYWAYDVGVLRRTFMKAGVKYASIDAKTHRALDDARVHAEEWRYYQTVIGGLERA